MWRIDDQSILIRRPIRTSVRCQVGPCSGFYVLTKHKDVFDASRSQQIFSSHEGGPVVWDLSPIS